MRRLEIGIVDYGAGNLTGLKLFFRSLGYPALVSSNFQELATTNCLVLPGVGAYREAMQRLELNNLRNLLTQRAKENSPIIGICLGMQLLATSSTEYGFVEGLNLIPGNVVSIGSNAFHIGWNQLVVSTKNEYNRQIKHNYFYFNHGYYLKLSIADKKVLAITETINEMPAIVKKGKIIGFQFHPEKSQEAGKKLMQRILQNLNCD